jgi:hypothetical protein
MDLPMSEQNLMEKDKSIKAMVCSHSRPDREVSVKLSSDSKGLYWGVRDGKLLGARFSAVDYHNENRAYWLRF